MGDDRLTAGLNKKKGEEMQEDKEEVCEGDTDPVTTAGPTTTRGSGFFRVSLESGRKVDKNYRVKVERLHKGE